MSEHPESQHDDKYTQPELRAKLKDQIEKGGKGGKPGQWSARKSQLLVKAYEDAGGGYKGEKDERAKSLDRWTGEDWQTEKGGDAQHGEHEHRYLPKKVWDRLSDDEKKEADAAKDQAKGQRVKWPAAVKREMKRLRDEENGGDKSGESKADLYAEAKRLDLKGRSGMDKAALKKAVEAAR